MPFYLELVAVCAIAFLLALAYQTTRDRGFGHSAHLAGVFAIVSTIVYFVVIVILSLSGVFAPEPPPAPEVIAPPNRNKEDF